MYLLAVIRETIILTVLYRQIEQDYRSDLDLDSENHPSSSLPSDVGCELSASYDVYSASTSALSIAPLSVPSKASASKVFLASAPNLLSASSSVDFSTSRILPAPPSVSFPTGNLFPVSPSVSFPTSNIPASSSVSDPLASSSDSPLLVISSSIQPSTGGIDPTFFLGSPSKSKKRPIDKGPNNKRSINKRSNKKK